MYKLKLLTIAITLSLGSTCHANQYSACVLDAVKPADHETFSECIAGVSEYHGLAAPDAKQDSETCAKLGGKLDQDSEQCIKQE